MKFYKKHTFFVLTAMTIVGLLFLVATCLSQSFESTKKLIIEKIEIEGNSKTEPSVILQYLTLQTGDFLDPADILICKQRLSQTQFFKNVDVYTRPGLQPGNVVIVVEVEERKWPYYQFEGGTSDLDGWYIIPVSFHFDNFFGKGNIFGWQWRIGNHISGSSFFYRKSNIPVLKADLKFDLFSQTQEFLHYIDELDTLEKVKTSGFRIKLNGKPARYGKLFFLMKFLYIKPFYNEYLASYFPDDFQNIHYTSFTLGLNQDNRDNSAYPLNGFWGEVSGELASQNNNKNLICAKLMLDSRYYLKLRDKHVLALHIECDYTGKNTPFYNRFYLGGPYSVRGYLDRRLTPIGWGTKLFLLQSEIRFPLSKKNFPSHTHTAVLFFDTGGLWVPGQSPDHKQLYSGLGFGYRIKLPIVGITRFDFGFPLKRIDDNRFMFHIALGHTF